jgi:serine carboxypeptidase-like clade 1
VEVEEQHGVQLFYYFVRSENDPDEDPLLLWLSGGPGCSGISGLAYEIGPLQFDAQGYRDGFPTLLYRPETWTKVRPFSSPQQCHFTEHMRLSSSESWVLDL